VQSQPLRTSNWGLTVSHGSKVLSPKYDIINAYMATLFGGEAWDLCVDAWVEQKS
jgi:hypothetical protein